MALDLRKAGLGLLGNIVGDKKAVACIEDTAVALPVLANYIEEFSEIMKNMIRRRFIMHTPGRENCIYVQF